MNLFRRSIDEKMIPLPPQAIKAIKEQEAKEKGKLWLEEVTSSLDFEFFEHYAVWAHVYERALLPPKKAVTKSKFPTPPSAAIEVHTVLSGENESEVVSENVSKAVAELESEEASKHDSEAVSKNEPEVVSEHENKEVSEQELEAISEKEPELTSEQENKAVSEHESQPKVSSSLEKKSNLITNKMHSSSNKHRRKEILESKNENLTTLRSGLSAKFVLMILDVAAHLLQSMETELSEHRPFVNAIRGLLLTYRFEKPNLRRKIFHLRNVACDRLVELLDLKLRDQSLGELQLACRESLLRMHPQKLLEQEWKAWIEGFLKHDSGNSTPISVPSNVTVDTVLSIAGLSPLLKIQEENYPSIREQAHSLIKVFAMTKMKEVPKALAIAIEQFLLDFAVAKFAPDTSKKALPLRDELKRLVDTQYKSLHKLVTHDVSGIVDLLGDMMNFN
jgi:hypothetical protein